MLMSYYISTLMLMFFAFVLYVSLFVVLFMGYILISSYGVYALIYKERKVNVENITSFLSSSVCNPNGSIVAATKNA